MPCCRSQLVEAVQKTLGRQTSKAAAERALNAVLEAIQNGVRKDKIVQLVGFGTFKQVQRRARAGVNPRNQSKIRIPARKSIKFIPGKAFKDSL
ncbi:MAG: HU family DNA-binding protein [Candidatus Methylacidiphilales bacterium]|nr:HU family DNA-binding protein [Candidatus Methylacidiphilales bacterium]